VSSAEELTQKYDALLKRYADGWTPA
jgi:carbonic anhydrase